MELTDFYDTKTSKNINEALLGSSLTTPSSRVKFPSSQKNLKFLFKKTLEKLKKYKNDHSFMKDKITDLQMALDFKEELVGQLKDMNEDLTSRGGGDVNTTQNDNAQSNLSFN